MKTETVNSISSQEGLQEKREETNVVDETQARLATYVTLGEAATFTQEVKKSANLVRNFLPEFLRDFTCWICSELNRPMK